MELVIQWLNYDDRVITIAVPGPLSTLGASSLWGEKKESGRKVKSKHINDTRCFPEVCLLLPVKEINRLRLWFGQREAGSGHPLRFMVRLMSYG